MSFFQTKKDTKILSETSGGSSFISTSGIYDVKLNIVSVATNDQGAMSLNFNVEQPNGSQTTFYGLQLTNNDGSDNFQAEIFNRLAVIADLDTVNDPEEQEHKLGKDAKPTTLAVLDDFTDFECKIRVQEEYSKWNDQISKKMKIRNFYRVDGASAAEAVSGEGIGTQIAKDEKYASNVTYKDNLTAEDVATWKESNSKNKTATADTKAEVKTKPAGSLFG